MPESTPTRSAGKAPPRPDVAVGFELADFLPYRLAVVANRVSRMFARRFDEAVGLSMWEWRLLVALGRVGAVSFSAAPDITAMDKAKVSRAIIGLEARSLLRRSEGNRRARVLRLTAKGTATYHQPDTSGRVLLLMREMERQVTAGLSPAEVEMLRHSLGRLLVHVDALSALDCSTLDG
jgi:DNA-binding MarR family transcriptional regulator